MLEILTSTEAASSMSFGNTTAALATIGLPLENNATEFWNSSDTKNDASTTFPFELCDASNPDFNCSVDEYLGIYMGARQMPLETAVWVSLFTIQISRILNHDNT